ncbi:DUF6221 family protein [Streptomyces anulatus]|uniref:DUF6221 family protein n=1 Tax=Streptomyces anulatus TaxID=1892 RepID=UPI0022591DD7|nr:DUF6221 family protein [Streptomyces anulatus]MCX4605485.1 DUF6221 family protein [Streptomyces anulatus]
MSDDLVQFLRDRLDDDERIARHAVDGPWVDPMGGPIWGGYEERFVIAQQVQRWNSQHIVRHDPARVLREVDAKRAVLNAYLPPDADVHPALPCINFEGQDPADYDEYDSCSRHLDAAPRSLRSDHVLRLLALPYADHSDYRDEWRPDDTR